MDRTLIVTKEASTAKNDLTRTRDELNKVDAKIAGIVFNSVNPKTARTYNYSYYGETKA